MPQPKRIKKPLDPIRNNALKYLIKFAKQGSTLKPLTDLLKKKGLLYNREDLAEDYRKLLQGYGYGKAISQYRYNQQLPKFLFIPQHGRMLTPYKVNVTFSMRNTVLGNRFQRTVNLEFEKRPTRNMIERKIQDATEFLWDNSKVKVTGSEINFLSTSID